MKGWEKKILRIVQKVNPNNPIEYVRNIVKDEARKKLDKKIKACNACDISSSVRTTTHGNTNANILVLMDVVPQQQRAEIWNMVEMTFQANQIDITDCFFVHNVNCCPYLKLERGVIYRLPNIQEKESCKPFLDQAIEIIKPKFMIILGNTALNSLIKTSVDDVHGKLLDIMGIPSIATVSPNYLLWCQEHDPDAYECERNIFFKDFEKIGEELHRKEHL